MEKIRTKSKSPSASQMRASLKKLEQDDPELAESMKKSDSTIFDFDVSSSSEGEGEGMTSDEFDTDEDVVDNKKSKSKKAHSLPKKLKVASDSESEGEETVKKGSDKQRQLVTLKMVRSWVQQIEEADSLSALHDLMSALSAAVHHADLEGKVVDKLKYRVEGAAVFNEVVSSSIKKVHPFLERFLVLPPRKDPNKIVLPSTSNKWKRVKVEVKSYVNNLLQLLTKMASPEIISVLLRNVHQMVVYYACFPKLPKLLLKKLIGLWSTTDEMSRVLALRSIIRLVIVLKDSLLEYTLKQMYRTYVSNCKFTSVNTLHLINFMQRSLVELLGIKIEPTYNFSFIYIRQLAIHLRTAITVQKKDQKKESRQTVYNWQFVHSLNLWTRLICEQHADESIRSLIYPLTQTILGTARLVPSAQYFPLRFHCIRALNMLSEHTGVYIPVLPLLSEVLDAPDMRRKPKAAGAKAFTFECILKLTKPQVQDKVFKDGVIDQLYELYLEHMNIHSHTLAFPELVLPALLQLKKFIKTCRTPAHGKKLKQLVDKVEEASKLTVLRRSSATINLRDAKAVAEWEANNKAQGNPLSTFIVSWRKLKERQQMQLKNPEKMMGGDLPKIQRQKGPKSASTEERQEFSKLFDSDSEEEDGTRFLPREERPKKAGDEKKAKKPKTSAEPPVSIKRKREEDSDESDYSDFDDDDLAKLNRSDSEDEGDDDDDDDGKDDQVKKKAVKPKEDDDEIEEPEGEDIVEDFVFSDDEDDD